MKAKHCMAFAKTKIVCHGARATRIGEKLLRNVWKYLNEAELDISRNDRLEMFNLLTLESIINYPDDMENMDTGCDVIIQIVYGKGQEINEAVKLSQEKLQEIPSIMLVINGTEQQTVNSVHISVNENEIIDTFRDIFLKIAFDIET